LTGLYQWYIFKCDSRREITHTRRETMARYRRNNLDSAVKAAQHVSTTDRPAYIIATGLGYAVVSQPAPFQGYYKVQGQRVAYVEYDTGCPKEDIDWAAIKASV
jgi:hypothetical protein